MYFTCCSVINYFSCVNSLVHTFDHVVIKLPCTETSSVCKPNPSSSDLVMDFVVVVVAIGGGVVIFRLHLQKYYLDYIIIY